MSELSLKTRFLNGFRNFGKLSFLERFLVERTQGKTNSDFFSKIIPNNYQYAPKTMRRCRRDGIEYNLDISDYMQYCIYYGIITEPREHLYNLVKNGTTVIDVGTNIGETLLNFARINPDGTNIGFEPVPFLYEQARENIAINNFSNIILENTALSDQTGSLIFNFEKKNNSGGIFLTSAETSMEDSRVVSAECLDEYVKRNKIENISLIKIDVEGFEINVLKGAAQTLKQNKPTLFVEINDDFLRRQKGTASELLDFLRSFDYSIYYAEDMQELLKSDKLERRHFDVVCTP